MSNTLVQPARQPRCRRYLAAVGVGALLCPALVLAASPASAVLTTTSDAGSLASAMAGPGASVTGASFVEIPPSGIPHAVSTTPLAGSPTNGAEFAILTTGSAALADDPDVGGSSGANLGGGARRGNTDRDVSILKVDLDVPTTANCLSFDFKFLSEEYPEYVGSSFNDAFIAELDTSTWTTSGSTISAPDNFAFDTSGNEVSVNAVGLGGFSAANAVGTTYDGATPQLSAATQLTPGAHSLYLSIFDQGDNILDSATFVDNLRVGFVSDPATQCKPGAQVKQFELDLAPASATKETGTSHAVTATLQDLNATPPKLAGGTVLFTTTGTHSGSGPDVTDSNGEATFSYTGSNVGTDTISACYDHNANSTCDADEPFASAQVKWTNAPPTNDANGPYHGDEGSPVNIAGDANDVNDDPLTHSWTYSPGAGVDPGATCSFSDDSALSTSVSCTDDGTYELTLSTEDGVNAPVSGTAELTLDNLPPSIESVVTPVDPVATGSTVHLDATYSDLGSNDTHTASIDWGDGTTTAPTASGGTVSGTHSYSSAGIYTVCITVTDDDGDYDSECSADYAVVYDPNAGFVTGGGWVAVPAGSYAADPSASGPGRFGFVSKYKKGATTPVGNTEFQFHAGNLNFHSSSYEWLVIAGAKAMYKGSGEINGESGYKFLLSAVDGAKSGGGGTDKFRIKIWDADTGVVVFDNQMGASDDAGATTAISKGSIVIHN